MHLIIVGALDGRGGAFLVHHIVIAISRLLYFIIRRTHQSNFIRLGGVHIRISLAALVKLEQFEVALDAVGFGSEGEITA
jgi:hypothetical protein